ncbi:MAG: diaminopropionate ammonia-lyase [Rhodobacteraceae bacterium]|nr:diaminopropionate ammonia-lyase [Paracoccaceae bacterium]
MSSPRGEYSFVLNAAADKTVPYSSDQADILNDAAFDLAKGTISNWPGYVKTPLVGLPGVAKEAGIAALYYKDEAERFGLGSFKALGGAYAVWQVLVRKAAQQGVKPSDSDAFASVAAATTVCCATDGNHGRSVAWGAQTFGCNCVIFIHATVSEGRKSEIEKYGAQVIRCSGNYDDSIRAAQENADREGWVVVSDTSYEGYLDIPKDVMQGYELMAAEANDQWPDNTPPTHIFLQTGVGGMAAAVTAYFWRRYAGSRPTIVLADPINSACWLETIKADKPCVIEGDLDTLMAGLACGEVSALAWTILRPSADAVIALDDDAAVDGMKLLAEGRYGDAPLVAGESAVAGLMALLLVAEDIGVRAALGLDENSRVLTFGTEGATDVDVYTELVGKTPEEVSGGAA